MTSGPLIVQSDRTVLLEVAHPDAETARHELAIFAELERLTSHLGDLAGICLDTAYGFGAFQFRMLRGWAYLMADLLCGMRFLRSVNAPGGLRRDFFGDQVPEAVKLAEEIRDELEDTAAIVRRNGFFIDRVENTGILSQDIARDLHATGPGGRASGVPHDVRRSYPYAAYPAMAFDGNDLLVLSRSGDENAKNAHDANLLLLHRIRNFRGLVY